jgi:hypothetical protein
MQVEDPTPERINEIKNAVGMVLDAIASGELPISEFMQMLGITKGRTAIEVARIAYAPDDGAFSIEEILTDAAIRSQLLRKAATQEEIILVLQDKYRREAEAKSGVESTRLPVTASAKLSGLNQLIELLGMKWHRNSQWSSTQKPATTPAENKTVQWSTAVPIKNAASA